MKHLIKITILLLLILSNAVYSQDADADTTAFYKAKQKIESCRSGEIKYKLSKASESGFDESKSYWDVELHFIKNDENKICFYIEQYDDTLKSEYAYYNDTLLTFAEYYSKRYTDKPFKGNVKDALTYLIDGQFDLTKFFRYDRVKTYDTILPAGRHSGIAGEAFTFAEDTMTKMSADFYTKIVLDRDNSNLVSCFDSTIVYLDGAFLYKVYTEYMVDAISLYEDKKQDIEDRIKAKYHELDIIITPNLQEKPEQAVDTASKEIPKYAYEWMLPLVNGETLFSQTIDSKIMVLDFYYMSCAPCVMAINYLTKLDSIYDENDVAFIGVNVADMDTARINRFMADRNIKYRNVINGIALANEYGFRNFPEVLIIETKTTEILHRTTGYRSDGLEYYKELLDGFLDKIRSNQ